MTALTADRGTPRRTGETYSRPVAAGVKIFAGALVVLNAAGYAEPGQTSAAVTPDGRAEHGADNTAGAAGAITVEVRPGVYSWANSTGADAITQANIGGAAYIVDDQTVALTSAGATRSQAGRIVDVDSLGVWVETGVVAVDIVDNGPAPAPD